MKGIRTAASVILCALLLAAGIAAECLALVKYTALNPVFYGEGESDAYALIGKVVVRRLSDGVLEKVPPIALRTTDGEKAFELASEALPPEKIAEMLESSGPAVANFLLKGGDLPVLNGAAGFQADETALMKSLVMDDLLKLLPEKPSFPAFMPFTPEWNLVYGPSLNGDLALPRYYAGMAGYMLGMAVAAVVLFAGLLYLLWIRERKPFLRMTGGLLTLNGLLSAVVAAIISFNSKPMADNMAASYALGGAADLFGADWPALVLTVLWPFRQIFFVAAVISFSLAAAALGASVTQPEPRAGWADWGYAPKHRREKQTVVKKLKPVMAENDINPEENESMKGKKPRHGKHID